MLNHDIIFAAKCAPEKGIFFDIRKAGLKAVELYLSKALLDGLFDIIRLCKDFSFRYALHAPNDCYNPGRLAKVAESINAEIVVFHNIYYENEWEAIIKVFKDIKTKLCIENTYSVHEPLKFIRKYGLYRCLDLEHLQMECCGVYEEEFMNVIKQASHIHLTGYKFGSELWHTPIQYSPKHNLYMLDLLRKVKYSGFVVSESRISFQTFKEFKKLNDFYEIWRKTDSINKMTKHAHNLRKAD